MGEARRISPAALRGFVSCGKSVPKFAITRPADLVGVTELEERFALSPVWVMPVGARSWPRCRTAGSRLLRDVP